MYPMKYGLLRVLRLLTATDFPIIQRYKLIKLVPQQGQVDGYIGPYLFTFNFADRIQRYIYMGMWERDETIILRHLLRPGDMFIDVGANIGFYSLIAASLVTPTGKVHAFEPVPSTAASLQRAIHVNNIEHIVLQQQAVGAQSGELTLYVDSHASLEASELVSAFASERGAEPMTVEQVSLDDYVERQNLFPVRLIKLDIEGYELQALQGMTRLLDREDAPLILCEVSPHCLSLQGIDSRAVTRYLADRGYSMYAITQSYWQRILRPFVATPPLPLVPVDPDNVLGFANLVCTKDSTVVRVH